MAGIHFVCCTCKRLDLFLASMINFREHCLDADLVDCYTIIDDNSDDSERKVMMEAFPEAEFVFKGLGERGHARSLNMMLQRAKADVLLYWEDDSFFTRAGRWIEQCLAIMAANPIVAQVSFDSGVLDYPTIAKTAQLREEPLRHAILESPAGGYVAPSQFVFDLHPWPGFTLRPHLLDLRRLRGVVDCFDESDISHMEYEFGVRFRRAGLRTAVLLDTRVEDRSGGRSAYRLNGWVRSWEAD